MDTPSLMKNLEIGLNQNRKKILNTQKEFKGKRLKANNNQILFSLMKKIKRLKHYLSTTSLFQWLEISSETKNGSKNQKKNCEKKLKKIKFKAF